VPPQQQPDTGQRIKIMYLFAASATNSNDGKIQLALSFRDDNWKTFMAALEISGYYGDTPEQFAETLRNLADMLVDDYKKSSAA
jgi:galactose-1-phosphate uridylyltransferase